MPLQRNAAPEFHPGEETVLEAQGGYKEPHRRGWQPVQIFLTNHRLICYLRPQIKFQIAINRIKKLTDEKHYYVLKVRDVLCIAYEGIDGSRSGKVLLITNQISQWKEKINQLCFLKIDLHSVQQIADQLDAEGRDVLWHLWEHRHARIDKLGELIGAPDHLHVLSLITETINPISQRVLGCPILSFEKKRIDPESGETVAFSWWMIGQKAPLLPSDERLVDIFEEGETIRVIMEVRGVEDRDIRLDVDGDRLMVRSHRIGASLRERLLLPCGVKSDAYRLHIRNNFLEIRLSKASSSVVSSSVKTDGMTTE